MSFNSILTQSRPTVLIVDDNLSFVKRIIGLLREVKNIGHINVAAECIEAARIFEEQKPDVVVLDISMPGKSGMSLLKQFKQAGNNCQVIMLTNHADQWYRDHCYDLGVDYFLDKSHDFAKVPIILGMVQQAQKTCA